LSKGRSYIIIEGVTFGLHGAFQTCLVVGGPLLAAIEPLPLQSCVEAAECFGANVHEGADDDTPANSGCRVILVGSLAG